MGGSPFPIEDVILVRMGEFMANLAGGGAIQISRLHTRNTTKAWETLEGQSLESGPKISPLMRGECEDSIG